MHQKVEWVCMPVLEKRSGITQPMKAPTTEVGVRHEIQKNPSRGVFSLLITGKREVGIRRDTAVPCTRVDGEESITILHTCKFKYVLLCELLTCCSMQHAKRALNMFTCTHAYTDSYGRMHTHHSYLLCMMLSIAWHGRRYLAHTMCASSLLLSLAIGKTHKNTELLRPYPSNYRCNSFMVVT